MVIRKIFKYSGVKNMNVDIKPLVESTPNDMELGEKIRKIYWDRIDKINQLDKWDGTIYESPDGGETIYERPFGSDISERKLVKDKSQLNLFE
jgi:hypothetical protein